MVLRLNTNINKVDVNKIAKEINKRNQKVNFDSERLVQVNAWCNSTMNFLKRYINTITNHGKDDVINFNGRNNSPNHITNRILEYYNDASWVKKLVITNTGYRTSSLETLEALKGIAKSKNLDTSIIDAISMYNQTQFIVKNNLNAFNLSNIQTNVLTCSPRINIANTGRMTTSNPNIQGFVNIVKKCMIADEGWKIVSMDITGQEAHILLFGIMENKKLTEGYMKYKDPYKAFLHAADMGITPAIRKMVKVPVLAAINGMSIGGLKSRLRETYNKMDEESRKEIDKHGGYEHIGTTIYNLINNDSGYQKIVVNHTKKLGTKEAVRKGLFGSEFPLNNSSTKNGKINQLKNGFFQVTAAEILSLSIKTLLDMNIENKIKFLVPIYDEVVLMVKDDGELGDNLAIIENTFKPIVDNWARFQGTPIVDKHYDDGDPNKIITINDLKSLTLNEEQLNELNEVEAFINSKEELNWMW